MNWKALAEAAYEAWRKRINQEPDTCPCCHPSWDLIEEVNQQAWEAAVKEACDIAVRSFAI